MYGLAYVALEVPLPVEVKAPAPTVEITGEAVKAVKVAEPPGQTALVEALIVNTGAGVIVTTTVFVVVHDPSTPVAV